MFERFFHAGLSDMKINILALSLDKIDVPVEIFDADFKLQYANSADFAVSRTHQLLLVTVRAFTPEELGSNGSSFVANECMIAD